MLMARAAVAVLVLGGRARTVGRTILQDEKFNENSPGGGGGLLRRTKLTSGYKFGSTSTPIE